MSSPVFFNLLPVMLRGEMYLFFELRYWELLA